MGQQPQRTRPFVADPNDWEIVSEGGDEFEITEEPTAPPRTEKKPTWSQSLGLNEPTTSPMVGFMRGAGSGIVDLAQGAVSNVTGQLNAKLDAENENRRANGGRETATLPRVQNPESFAGDVGNVMPMIAETVATGRIGTNAVVDALPNAARAGRGFEQVMSAAGDVPVNVEAAGKSALRVMELAERGGTMPKAVRDLLKRVTDPAKPAMTYRESRDFASNLGKLSVDEMNRLKPIVKREVANMAAELNKANADAAKLAGKAVEYKSAMREYANAMRMRDALDTAIKHSKKAALGAAGLGGAAYWLGRD